MADAVFRHSGEGDPSKQGAFVLRWTGDLVRGTAAMHRMAILGARYTH